jgi:pimeloyl-ACP methyl ester carboxylesterase
MRRVYPGVPLFLGGVSMGGLIACLTALDFPVAGLVLMCVARAHCVSRWAGWPSSRAPVACSAPAVKPHPDTASPCLVREEDFARITA